MQPPPSSREIQTMNSLLASSQIPLHDLHASTSATSDHFFDHMMLSSAALPPWPNLTSASASGSFDLPLGSSPSKHEAAGVGFHHFDGPVAILASKLRHYQIDPRHTKNPPANQPPPHKTYQPIDPCHTRNLVRFFSTRNSTQLTSPHKTHPRTILLLLRSQLRRPRRTRTRWQPLLAHGGQLEDELEFLLTALAGEFPVVSLLSLVFSGEEASGIGFRRVDWRGAARLWPRDKLRAELSHLCLWVCSCCCLRLRLWRSNNEGLPFFFSTIFPIPFALSLSLSLSVVYVRGERGQGEEEHRRRRRSGGGEKRERKAVRG